MQLTLTVILSGKVGQIKIWCLFGVYYWRALERLYRIGCIGESRPN